MDLQKAVSSFKKSRRWASCNIKNKRLIAKQRTFCSSLLKPSDVHAVTGTGLVHCHFS